MSVSFGKKVRDYRKKMGLSLEELAEKLETTKNYVWQLENKSPARPSGKVLLKLAAIFETSPEFLIEDDAIEPSDTHLKEALWRKTQNLSSEDLEKIIQIVGIMDSTGKDN